MSAARPKPQSKSQQLQQLYQQTTSSEHVYWPKWNTPFVLKFDFFTKSWVQQS